MTPGSRVPFTDPEIEKVCNFFFHQLEEALDEHQEREQRLNDWQRCYDGDPKQAKRMFPWPGAANIEIPIIGIHVDSIVARIVNTLFSMDPFWIVRPLHKDTDAIAKPLEAHLNWSRQNEFSLYREVRNWSNELTKFGWSWLKRGWETYTVSSYVTNEYGQPMLKRTLVRRPFVKHVLCRDVIVQAGIEDEEQAEWVAQRIRLTDNQLRLRAFDNVYNSATVEEIIKAKEDIAEHHEAMKSSPMANIGGDEKLNTIYEISGDWPFGPDKIPVPMMFWFHRPSRKLLRAVFQPYPFRPLKKAQFINREGRLEGFGIAKRLFQMQEELGTLHRQQIDNSTIANTRFFVGRRNVIRPGTQIWPGRFLPVGDPERDIKALQLGDIYQSQGVLEMRALSYAERASGVSDYQLGRESSVAGSRATATGTLAVIQEGNRRFDLNIRDMRDVLSEVGRDILLLNQLFRPRGLAYFVQGQDGKFVEQALSLPAEFEVGKLAVELSATTATINKAIEKQELIAVLGLHKQYIESVFQAGMLLANPQMPGDLKEFIIKGLQGGRILMQKVIQSFDLKQVDEIVPGLVNEANREAAGQPGGSPGMPTGDPSDGKLENLSELYSQFTNASNGADEGRERLE